MYKRKLKKIIKEEVQRLLSESDDLRAQGVIQSLKMAIHQLERGGHDLDKLADTLVTVADSLRTKR